MSLPNQLSLAVQTRLHGRHVRPLTAEEQHLIQSSYKELNIFWLPDLKRPFENDTDGAFEEGIIYLFVAASVTFIATSFFSAMLKEAGTDAYKGIKTFISELIRAYRRPSYRVKFEVNLVCEFGNDKCIIRFYVLADYSDGSEDDHFEFINAKVSETLAQLEADWPQIKHFMTLAELGQRGQEARLCLIAETERGWDIRPVDWSELNRGAPIEGREGWATPIHSSRE